MEFSFGSKTWVPGGLLKGKQSDASDYALGLHAPGFFDKVLNVNKCLLQSEPANKVCNMLFISLKYRMIYFIETSLSDTVIYCLPRVNWIHIYMTPENWYPHVLYFARLSYGRSVLHAGQLFWWKF